MKNLIENWTKDMNSQLTEKEVQIANKQWENYTIWLDDREIQMKTTTEKKYFCPREAKFQKIDVVHCYVWMWELDCEESWAPKNLCFWTVVLEKTLENPLDCKEIQPVHSKGAQPWVFFGRNDAKAETPILWTPHAKSWLIGKDSDAGRDWGQEEKWTTEDEMAE